MTVQDAVEILNKVKHNGESSYEYRGKDEIPAVTDEYNENVYTEFETIAIAEKYEREGLIKCTEK